MMAHCPRHGPRRQYVYVSLDLEPEGEVEQSQIMLVDLAWGDRIEHVVTISQAFAQGSSIVQQTLDYPDTFANSQWFHDLTGMCCECYAERWPALLEDMKRRNR